VLGKCLYHGRGDTRRCPHHRLWCLHCRGRQSMKFSIFGMKKTVWVGPVLSIGSQAQVSKILKVLHYSSRDCMKFSIFGIKRTVQYREVSASSMGRHAQVSTLQRCLYHKGRDCIKTTIKSDRDARRLAYGCKLQIMVLLRHLRTESHYICPFQYHSWLCKRN